MPVEEIAGEAVRLVAPFVRRAGKQVAVGVEDRRASAAGAGVER